MPREDGLKYGIPYQFSSTRQPENCGRKPSKLKKWIKGNGVSKEDFIAIFKNIIALHTLEELQAMVDGDNKNKLPVIVALCISAFIHDMKTGTLLAANSILDRIIGRPAQSIDIAASGDLEITCMTPEERNKRINELLKKSRVGIKTAEDEHKLNRKRSGGTSRASRTRKS